MKLFELFATLGLDSAKFNSGISASRDKFASVVTSVSSGVNTISAGADKIVNKMTSIVTKASLAVVGVGTMLAKVGLTYNQQMEDYTNTFTVMLGSAEKAVDKVDELKKFAASTPFSMSDLADSTKTLLAFNVSSDKSTGIMRMLGDVALGNAEKFSRLSTAYGKANSLGKLTGEVYQQMVEAGFNPLNVIAQQTGESMEQLQKRMAAGKVSVAELEKAFKKATSEGGQFYKGMESASKTTSGLISTLKDNARALVGQVLTPMSDWVKKDLLPTTILYVENLTKAVTAGGEDLSDTVNNILGEIIAQTGATIPELIAKGVSFFDKFMDIIDNLMPTILDAGSSFLGALFDGMNSVMPRIANLAGEIAPMIFAAIISFKAEMLQSGIQIITSIAEGLAANSDSITSGISNVVSTILYTISTSIPIIIDSGGTVLLAILSGLTSNSSKIGETVTIVLNAIILFITENLPAILDAGIDILLAIVDGITGSIPLLAEKIPSIITGIVDKLKEKWPEIKEAGKNLIEALWEGIQSVGSWVAKKIGDMFVGIFNDLGANIGVDSKGNYVSLNRGGSNRSFSTGLDYVPSRGTYNLDPGEAVLTKLEADNWRKGNAQQAPSVVTNAPVVNIYANDTSYVEQQRALRQGFDRLAWEMNT